MKTVLLALGFGLICASSQFDPAEITGDWRTIYVAADNVEKIGENAELRVHFRHLECTEDCDKLGLSFYSKGIVVFHLLVNHIISSLRDRKEGTFLGCLRGGSNGECQNVTVLATKNGTEDYEAEYAGDNFFSIQYLANEVIAFYNENVDEQGELTHETLVAAKGNSLSEEELKKFEELTVEMKIPKENIRNIIETDDCPAA